jgi:hypothetical protein
MDQQQQPRSGTTTSAQAHTTGASERIRIRRRALGGARLLRALGVI